MPPLEVKRGYIVPGSGNRGQWGHKLKPAAEVRRHKGDIMSPEKRSALMSRIKGKGTLPERLVADALEKAGLEWEAHARDLPGTPDFVFRAEMVAVFVDGDFWHGWHFHDWHDKLSVHWEAKIAVNRARDQRNFRKLRRQGWVVLRLWEHQVHGNLDCAVERIIDALGMRDLV